MLEAKYQTLTGKALSLKLLYFPFSIVRTQSLETPAYYHLFFTSKIH